MCSGIDGALVRGEDEEIRNAPGRKPVAPVLKDMLPLFEFLAC